MARIAGVDLPREKRIEVSLTYVYGIGQSTADEILAGIDKNYIILEGDLLRNVALYIKRLTEIQCYRGVRHRKWLPCRGQRTKTNARTCKGPKRTVANKKK